MDKIDLVKIAVRSSLTSFTQVFWSSGIIKAYTMAYQGSLNKFKTANMSVTAF